MVDANDGGNDNQILEAEIIVYCFEDAPSDTPAAPATEPTKDAVPLTKQLGQVAPGCACAHDPQDTLDEQAVVATRRTFLVGPPDDQWRDPLLRRVAQNQLIHPAQGRFPKGSLESRFSLRWNPYSPQELVVL